MVEEGERVEQWRRAGLRDGVVEIPPNFVIVFQHVLKLICKELERERKALLMEENEREGLEGKGDELVVAETVGWLLRAGVREEEGHGGDETGESLTGDEGEAELGEDEVLEVSGEEKAYLAVRTEEEEEAGDLRCEDGVVRDQ